MSERTSSSTAAACARSSCQGCEIQGALLCLHTHADLVDFYALFLVWMVPFLAGMILGKFWLPLAIWLALAAVFFVYLEALVLCRHCPHYAEEGSTLRCHANWGLPKIPPFDPHPLKKWESATWLVYVAVLFLFYIPFFIISQQWVLLLVATTALLASAWTLQRTQCTRCYHLSCPVNRVPEEVREAFYRNYPAFAEARDRVD